MRRNSRQVRCGDVLIGGQAPVSIQSMTNTDTRDVRATLNQIGRLQEAGCQIVRCAVPDLEAVEALKEIKQKSPLPVVADIHFDYRLAVAAIQAGADKVRINPGNIGSRENVEKVLQAARERGIPLRVGVNSGSLEKDILSRHGGVTAAALAESALKTVAYIEDLNFTDLVVSLKSSDIRLNDQAHKLIAEKMDYPLHIGITESGTVDSGVIKSSIGIGSLLLAGIGDTVRVSLTGDPVAEIHAARQILKSLGLKDHTVNLISCPTCGRTRVALTPIARAVEEKCAALEREMAQKGLPSITVAVMGCEVNGPGEAKEADFGVACGKGKGAIFQKGKVLKTVPETAIAEELIGFIRERFISQRG